MFDYYVWTLVTAVIFSVLLLQYGLRTSVVEVTFFNGPETARRDAENRLNARTLSGRENKRKLHPEFCVRVYDGYHTHARDLDIDPSW